MGQERKKKRKKRYHEAPEASAAPLGPAPGVGPEPFARARRWAAAASLSLLLGIALTATDGAVLGSLRSAAIDLGPWFAAGAMAAGIAAAHSLGRCGPDPGEDFSS